MILGLRARQWVVMLVVTVLLWVGLLLMPRYTRIDPSESTGPVRSPGVALSTPESVQQAGIESAEIPSPPNADLAERVEQSPLVLDAERAATGLRARAAIRSGDPTSADLVDALAIEFAACAAQVVPRGSGVSADPHFTSAGSKLALAAFAKACREIGGPDMEADDLFHHYRRRYSPAEQELQRLYKASQDGSLSRIERAEQLERLLLSVHDLFAVQRVLLAYSDHSGGHCYACPLHYLDSLPGMGSSRLDFRSESFLAAVGLSVWCLENPQTCGPTSTLAFLLCRDRGICRPGYSVRDYLYDQHPARHVHAAQVAAQRIVTARREWQSSAGRGARAGS